MTQLIKRYLGWNYSGSTAEEQNGATRALPSNWYTSSEMYQLERRSIFSTKWMLITHRNRLTKPGDWLRFEAAGFGFIICRDREGNINAFHNVCRHRAFPVVEGDEGNKKIFTCKYHGWSYGLNGKLTKAPGYQGLDAFPKERNGLFPIHVHVDAVGFIWVNLDGRPASEITPWEQDFEGIDKQERYKAFNFDDYVLDHTYQMDGDYNWKILADNYNECYHCATTHPDISTLANLQSYSVDTSGNKIIHNPATTQEQADNGLTVASTYYFPNVSTNITPHFFMIQRFVPLSPQSSSMQYQVFRNKNSTDAQFDLVQQIYKRIMSEDKELCKQAQKNLNAGVFINGELHPRLEKGPLFFQKTVRDVVTAHYAKEQKERQEVWPARQKLPTTGNAVASQKDIDFCSGLSCQMSTPEQLVW